MSTMGVQRPTERTTRHKFLFLNSFGTLILDTMTHCRSKSADFIDGTLFAPGRLFLARASFAAGAPSTSDYT